MTLRLGGYSAILLSLPACQLGPVPQEELVAKLVSQVQMPKGCSDAFISLYRQDAGAFQQDYSNIYSVGSDADCAALWHDRLRNSPDWQCRDDSENCQRAMQRGDDFDEEWASVIFFRNGEVQVTLSKI